VSKKTLLLRALYWARDLRSGALHDILRKYCRGSVLDVGGWDFVLTALHRNFSFERWCILEVDSERLLSIDDPRVQVTHGDGTQMIFGDATFDTVLSIQVLEHVFEPMRMVREIARVLKPGGHAVFLIPQTSTTHLAPHFYGNFSAFWIERAAGEAGLEIVEHRRLGGIWSSAASHFVYFFLQALRVEGMSDRRIRRPIAFWLLLPLQALWAVVNVVVCLGLSLGDLAEEPNNHLVVATRS
jgi:SAM-dependent methyltransferase